MAEIVRSSIIYTEENIRDPFFPDNPVTYASAKADATYYNYPNNLIIFTGKRGTGKSSAMLTFVKSLSNPESEMMKDDFIREMAKCELQEVEPEHIVNMMRNYRFVSLPTIDPTVLNVQDGSGYLGKKKQ